MTPFNITFKVVQWDNGQSNGLSLIAIAENFLIRKQVLINDAYMGVRMQKYTRERAEFELKRWFYTHVFYYSETNKWERFLLRFKEQIKVDGAIIKELFNKTYIIELI